MTQTKAVGPAAAARKYDLLTALGAHALAQDKHCQRMVLRLITLITARYNWVRDELSVGQREIAALWCCDERTVKREMARLRGLGWLVVRRQGARGRVTQYRMDSAAILTATKGRWAAIGPDYVDRQQDSGSDRSVIPFPVRAEQPAPDPGPGTEWALARTLLHRSTPGPYAAWLHPLERAAREGDVLVLRAPSAFHAQYVRAHLRQTVLAAVRAVDATVQALEITN